jgi:hypothetical protein
MYLIICSGKQTSFKFKAMFFLLEQLPHFVCCLFVSILFICKPYSIAYSAIIDSTLLFRSFLSWLRINFECLGVSRFRYIFFSATLIIGFSIVGFL